MDLVDSSLGQIRSTNVKPHGEAFNDYWSYLQGLPFCSYGKGKGMFESPFDVKVGAFPSGPYLGNVIRFEVVLIEA